MVAVPKDEFVDGSLTPCPGIVQKSESKAPFIRDVDEVCFVVLILEGAGARRDGPGFAPRRAARRFVSQRVNRLTVQLPRSEAGP